MSHVRRLALATAFIIAVFGLGLVIDVVMPELWALTDQFNVADGPFGAVLPHIEGVQLLVVPALLLGIILWMIWGSIQEERREEARRRVGP